MGGRRQSSAGGFRRRTDFVIEIAIVAGVDPRGRKVGPAEIGERDLIERRCADLIPATQRLGVHGLRRIPDRARGGIVRDRDPVDDGDLDADADFERGTVEVSYNEEKVTTDDLKGAIEEAGYTVAA